MPHALQRAWLRRGPVACLLWPLSLLFGALAAARRLAYRSRVLRTERLPVPVIVVGNVIAGGSGKTPIVIALIQHLRGRGIDAGVITRGYGRVTDDCREVLADSAPLEVGDEPLLVARASGAPVFVAVQRAEAGRALLAARPHTQVIVCDDGLQHQALERDVEICVFDERGVGNGWLLPAGPLREAWPKPVDLVLQSGDPAGVTGFGVGRKLGSLARRSDGQEIALELLTDRPLTALAGIAKPEVFFAMLRDRGLRLERTLALPDHHDFSLPVPGTEGSELVCTEKDAVKLWRIRPDAWSVALKLEIDPRFWVAFDRLVDAKLSSAHGSQTS
ncbi:MAG: tetraacyldisaccharide 4'-kinase [Ramlibacter sp.]